MMQRLLKISAAFALALSFLGAVAQAAPITNRSDAWAWITVYSGARSGIMHSFCLAPGQHAELPSSGIVVVITPTGPHPARRPPYEIRAEVTKRNCAHPVMLDATLGYDGNTPFFVHGLYGHYAFRHTP